MVSTPAGRAKKLSPEITKVKTIQAMIIGADSPIGQSFELTTRIKAAQPEIICILASGNPADALRASEAGTDAFMLKPYGVSDLFALVQTFVVKDQGRRG